MEETLPVESPEAFSGSGDHEMPDNWWTAFGDGELNAVVETALANNFNIRSAWQRLVAARAVVDRESASMLPSVQASAEGGVSRVQTEFEESQRFRLGLSTVYEVDLWGRIGSRVDAERYRAEATFADYQTAAITLSSEITRTWFQILEAREQLDLLLTQIETNEKILEILLSRFGNGQIRRVDILRQRQLLEASRQQHILAESRTAVLNHRLAILLGQPPMDTMTWTKKELPDLPPLPTTGVPLELIRRRPDVQSAYHLLQAADRDLASAMSSRYPRLTLSAEVSSASTSVGNLFEDWAASLAGNLVAPLFYGGELSAEVDRAEAVKQQLLYEYGQTVLTAFREVEDALIREQKQAEGIVSLETQLGYARQTYEQLRIEYFNGISDYLDVLTTLDQEQQLQRDVLTAKLNLLEYRIDLYRALAGSFKTDHFTEELNEN